MSNIKIKAFCIINNRLPRQILSYFRCKAMDNFTVRCYKSKHISVHSRRSAAVIKYLACFLNCPAIITSLLMGKIWRQNYKPYSLLIRYIKWWRRATVNTCKFAAFPYSLESALYLIFNLRFRNLHSPVFNSFTKCRSCIIPETVIWHITVQVRKLVLKMRQSIVKYGNLFTRLHHTQPNPGNFNTSVTLFLYWWCATKHDRSCHSSGSQAPRKAGIFLLNHIWYWISSVDLFINNRIPSFR